MCLSRVVTRKITSVATVQKHVRRRMHVRCRIERASTSSPPTNMYTVTARVLPGIRTSPVQPPARHVATGCPDLVRRRSGGPGMNDITAKRTGDPEARGLVHKRLHGASVCSAAALEMPSSRRLQLGACGGEDSCLTARRRAHRLHHLLGLSLECGSLVRCARLRRTSSGTRAR